MPFEVLRNNNRYTNCVGIDDGPFPPKGLERSKAPLIAVLLRGPHLIRAEVGWITVDGLDATVKAIALLNKLHDRSCPILLAGATFAGFNIIDPRALQERFRTPTIVVVGSRPDNRSVKRALVKHFPDWRRRWGIIRSLGPLYQVRTVAAENPVFFESFGCTVWEARRILSEWAFVSRLPEPLRVAGLVARGLFSSEPPVWLRSYRRL